MKKILLIILIIALVSVGVIYSFAADERKAAFINSLRNASAAERQELESAFELHKEYSVPEINKNVADFFLGEDR